MFSRWINNRQGSFFLEALIAVSILSISLVVIIHSHLAALQAQVFAKNYTLASLLLEREMIDVVEKGYIERGINKEKSLEKPYERFTFSLKTSAAGEKYFFDGLNEVQMTLSWKEGAKPHKLSVSTYVFNTL